MWLSPNSDQFVTLTTEIVFSISVSISTLLCSNPFKTPEVNMIFEISIKLHNFPAYDFPIGGLLGFFLGCEDLEKASLSTIYCIHDR